VDVHPGLRFVEDLRELLRELGGMVLVNDGRAIPQRRVRERAERRGMQGAGGGQVVAEIPRTIEFVVAEITRRLIATILLT
jgi:hypothetical protein